MPLKWITFDCYGTLIDWEEGILKSLTPFLKRASKDVSPKRLLALYATLESEAEKEWRPYREVLQIVGTKITQALGIPLKDSERDFLVRALPFWRPFPEANETLFALKARGFKLAIISNIDNDLLAQTLKHFEVSFDLLVTAEEARCYKPYPAIFSLAQEKLKSPPSEIFHVAQSLFHDISPARRLGWKTCWVRRPGRDPHGATPRVEAQPDFTISNLKEILPLLEEKCLHER